MKLKSDFLLHSIGSEHVVVPINERTAEFHGMIRLNKTGAFLWEQMRGEFTVESLADALTAKYDISPQDALRSATEFADKLINAQIIEE